METTKTMNKRVAQNTAEDINRRIRQETDENAKFYAQHSEFIPRRLQELEEEWDIEKTLETNASALSLFGILLSLLVDRRFLLLPALVGVFLLQHGLQGWCPPLALFRYKGVRTRDEILRERNLLKAISGNYDDLCVNQEAKPLERLNQAFRAFNEK